MTMVLNFCPQLFPSKCRLHVPLGNKGVRCLQFLMVLAIGSFCPTFINGVPAQRKGLVTDGSCTPGRLSSLTGAFAGFFASSAAQAVETAADKGEAGASALSPMFGAGVLAVAAAIAFPGRAVAASSDGSVDDKKEVTEYFNGEGFNRWSRIYNTTDDVNAVQMDIRTGHARTVEKILGWLDYMGVKGKKICDAGCGTGSLSIPLASRGALVSGSDISSAMVTEAAERAKVVLQGNAAASMPKFETRDLEAIEGQFDTVCCVDVLIHYPPEKLDAMVGNLAKLSSDKVILSFAPDTWYYKFLKRVGELFPGKSKTTRAYLHKEEVVEAALQKAGFEIERWEMTSTNFYFSRLFQAKRVST
mmetsp:Transcript_117784/g.229035  ORF Transcript_117784/g.229035 Transcript_117784/m.229035 type:complete len:360 (-) Transcript_117784:127-1206(-)